jgi:enoyl-CoA hydratase/carnithine racemase
MDVHFRLVDRDLGEITSDDGKSIVLNQPLLAELAALNSLDPSRARFLLLRAAPGARVFPAGHDIHELPTDGRDPLARTALHGRARLPCPPPDPETQKRLHALHRDLLYQHDFREGIRAFLEKRPPEFHGY